MDLSNARIIEWGEGGATFVGARTSPRNGFQTVSANAGGAANHAGFITELEAEQIGARVVAEFPRPSLAERVGDAPAFLFTLKAGPYAGKRGYAVRELNGGWDWDLLRDAQHLHVGQLPPDSNIDVATVVPLFPREVVS